MSEKSYYDILGVDKDATQEEIKTAFRKLSKKHHPDTKGGDVQTFQKINEAYQVLSDPEKREEYDREKSSGDWFQGYSAGPKHHVDPEEFFTDFVQDFKQRSRRRKKRKKKVLYLYLDFEDILETQKYEVSNGYKYGKNSYTVEIPSGAESGYEKNVDPAYNIFVRAHVNEPKEFDRRDGTDIWKTVKVSPLRSVIGGEVTVENPHGKKINVKVPRGTKNGETFKISGHGVQSWNKENGDLFVTIEIGESNLSDEQIDDLQSFLKEKGWNTEV
jgi:DnaJ-class molecular chaperone